MEIGITHFTSQQAAAAIFDGWRRDLILGDQSSETTLGPREIKLRLHSRLGTNDPLEHKMVAYGEDTTIAKSVKGQRQQFRATFPDDVFMWCGSVPQTDELANRLEMWRAYGDNGRGVALTMWWDDERLKEEGLEILEMKYVSSIQAVMEEMDSLIRAQSDLERTRAERESSRIERMRLGASYKRTDYSGEKEVRLVCFLGDESGSVRKSGREGGNEIHLEASSGRLRTFIERPIKLGSTLMRIDITLGPRMIQSDAEHWTRFGRWMFSQMGVSGGKIGKSKLDYIG